MTHHPLLILNTSILTERRLMELVNHTPHPITVYAADTPDVLAEGAEPEIIGVIPRSGGLVAHLHEGLRGAAAVPTAELGYVPLQVVHYSPQMLIPHCADTLHIVPLATMLALPPRPDVAAPYAQVRNAAGTVVGCRAFATRDVGDGGDWLTWAETERRLIAENHGHAAIERYWADKARKVQETRT